MTWECHAAILCAYRGVVLGEDDDRGVVLGEDDHWDVVPLGPLQMPKWSTSMLCKIYSKSVQSRPARHYLDHFAKRTESMTSLFMTAKILMVRAGMTAALRHLDNQVREHA